MWGCGRVMGDELCGLMRGLVEGEEVRTVSYADATSAMTRLHMINRFSEMQPLSMTDGLPELRDQSITAVALVLEAKITHDKVFVPDISQTHRKKTVYNSVMTSVVATKPNPHPSTRPIHSSSA